MPFNLSTGELLVLLLVAVVVFGGRLPGVARKAGSVISDFKRGMRDEVRRMDDFIPSAPPPDWTPPGATGDEEKPKAPEASGEDEPDGSK
ncbi:MAG: twin-arginine translocase TatA/TatE family subunit [Planctomycetota bacterium]